MRHILLSLLMLIIIPSSLAHADHIDDSDDMHSFDGLTVVFMDLATKAIYSFLEQEKSDT